MSVESEPQTISDALFRGQPDAGQPPPAEPPTDEAAAAGPDAEPQGSPDEPPPEQTADAPLTLKALSEKTGLDMDALYAAELDLGDDTKATIGDLKHRAKALNQADKKLADLDERESDFRATQLRSRKEIALASQLLTQPGGVTRENLEQLEAINQRWEDEQTALVKAIAPEALSEESQQQLAGFAARFEVSPAELAQVTHAGFRLILDDWRMLRARLADIENGKPKPRNAQKPQGGQPPKRTAKEKVAAGEITGDQGIASVLFGR